MRRLYEMQKTIVYDKDFAEKLRCALEKNWGMQIPEPNHLSKIKK
jgi:hypothetical protein